MYKIETIQKLMKRANDLFEYYKNSDAIPGISISKGNRKIGKVLNFSTMPIIACGNHTHCMHICYDIKACIQYSAALEARIRNTVLARQHRDELFATIDGVCTRRKKNKYFRWHVAGDILDYDYFCRMVEIAEKHPDFIFWTYTKMYDIVNEWCDKNGKLPSNLSVMFSEWKTVNKDGNYTIVPFDNRHNFPVFAVRFKGEEAPNMFKCPGNCDVCKEAKRGCPYGESSYADEH